MHQNKLQMHTLQVSKCTGQAKGKSFTHKKNMQQILRSTLGPSACEHFYVNQVQLRSAWSLGQHFIYRVSEALNSVTIRKIRWWRRITTQTSVCRPEQKPLNPNTPSYNPRANQIMLKLADGKNWQLTNTSLSLVFTSTFLTASFFVNLFVLSTFFYPIHVSELRTFCI